MYKVFIDNIPIYFEFQEGVVRESNIPSSFFPSLPTKKYNIFRKVLPQIQQKEKIKIITNQPSLQFQLFFKHFRWIEAAGGIVINTNVKKALFIFRNGKWDIPKGGIEGETVKEAAIREIQEETGLHKVRIKAPLPATYHVYFAYNHYWVKKTNWFWMETEEKKVVPQKEEGITKVKWFSPKELNDVKQNTHTSLLDIIHQVEQSIR